MIESTFRNTYQKYCVDPLLKREIFRKVHPTLLTALGCLVGACILPLLAFDLPLFALALLALSGFLDTLDGSLARLENKTSDKGAALDILSDRIVEVCIILGLFLVDPSQRALPSLCVLASALLCVTSFLIVGVFTAIPKAPGKLVPGRVKAPRFDDRKSVNIRNMNRLTIVEPRGFDAVWDQLSGCFGYNHSVKSFHYSPGIIERAEAFLFFSAMIAFPTLFLPLSYLFSALVLITAGIRMLQFLR